MKTYRVGFWYTESGVTSVQANSAKEAEQRLYKELEDNGIDVIEYSIKDREYGTASAELKEE